MYYTINIAGYSVNYLFHTKETVRYFKKNAIPTENNDQEAVVIPEKLIEKYMKMANYTYPFAEYATAVYMASNDLLKNDICCFHSVALKVNGKGYLISAPSGVGKTTQYLNLKELYGDAVEIINGDKPFLEFLSDGIMIHSSLWRGKENYGSDSVCRLYGVINLVQKERNKVFRMYPDELVLATLRQFMYYPDTEEIIRKVCDLDRRLLNSVPLWQLENKGDLSSSKLLFETVMADGADI